MKSHPCTALLLSVLSWQVAGCRLSGPQVRLDRTGVERVHEELNATALAGGGPSLVTRQVVESLDLGEALEEGPARAAVELHRLAAREPSRVLFFALAELCFLAGTESGSRDHFLAAAVYAYLYLLGDDDPTPADPYERKFGWACELYNRSLLLAFAAEDGSSFVCAGGTRRMPVGSAEVTVDHSGFSGFPWSEERFPTFLPTDEYGISGFSLRRRQSGLGAPLIALPPANQETDGAGSRKLSQERASLAATAFLRVNGGIRDVEEGIEAKLELYSAASAQSVNIGGRSVPLEVDYTAALAFSLEESKSRSFWFDRFFGGEGEVRVNRIVMFQPYARGKIPVVFVPGAASRPTAWAEMFNSLLADPVLRERFQIWFFQYSSGNPILYSAGTLRDALQEAVSFLDPEGTDSTLRRMVVIGHSQGGLLTKMMVVQGGDPLWKKIAGVGIEELKLKPEEEALLRWAFYFQPLRSVWRVVFIATPHRGSLLARRFFSRWIAGMISMPKEVRKLAANLLSKEARFPANIRSKSPTSLYDMDPESPFLNALEELPVAPRVSSHSIIAIGKAREPEGADDGVVEYSSARLAGVDSEFLVRACHSCQVQPRVIQEVRRILREHLESLDTHHHPRARAAGNNAPRSAGRQDAQAGPKENDVDLVPPRRRGGDS